MPSRRPASASELKRRAEALADMAANMPEKPELEKPAPLVAPAGFVDVVFVRVTLLDEDEGLVFQRVEDANGNETEVGHWLPEGDDDVVRYRLPFNPRVTLHVGPGPAAVPTSGRLELPKSGTGRAQVLGVFINGYKQGIDGWIDDELVVALSTLADGAVRARRHELVQMGWVEASGDTRPGPKGKDAKEWRLSDRGLAQAGQSPRREP